MKKLIVLMMTSVLATGAVANADQVNVTEDPGNVIFINPIVEENSTGVFGGGLLTEVSNLQPEKAPEGQPWNKEKYTIHGAVAETLESGAGIRRIAICFFDTRVADDSTKVANLCGYGSAADTLTDTLVDKGTNSPDSAVQVSVKIPDYTDLDNKTIENDNPENENLVQGVGAGSQAVKQTAETYFADNVSKDAIYFSSYVGLSHAMAAGTNAYKVRVVAIYDDNSVFALTDTRTYSVDTYHSIVTDRDAVNFEDMNPGDQRLKEGINAGEYYANTTANFSISATEFEISDVADSSVPFSTDNPEMGDLTAGEKFWLICLDNDSSPSVVTKYVTTDGQPFYSNQLGSNTQADPEAPKTLSDSMRCQLSVGDDVPFGEYTNTVEMGIS